MDHSADSVLSASPARLEGPLGTNAKSSPTSGSAVETQDLAKARMARAQRYQALAQARSFVGFQGLLLQIPGDKFHRIFSCHYANISDFIEVFHNVEHQKSFYGGLATCGSVWACPVCAAKIQERRRQELVKFIDYAYATEQRACFPALTDGSFVIVPKDVYSPVMVTFTFPHYAFQTLKDLILRQRLAFTFLRKGNTWDLFRKRFGFKGLIRSLEVTNGNNGWHPHTHELWLVRPMTSRDREDFVAFVKNRWRQSCIKAGLLDPELRSVSFDLHAIDVRFNVSSGEYLAKQDSSREWGADHEIAKASSKKGRLSGVHPHEFLIRNSPGDDRKYIEYATTMRDLRARQLYWSSGLKELVGLNDVTDEQIAQRKDERADVLGLITVQQWKIIRRAGAISEVLDCSDSGDWNKTQLLLKSLGALDADVEPSIDLQEHESEPPVGLRIVPKNLERTSLSKSKINPRCDYQILPFWLTLEQWSLVDSMGAAESLLGIFHAAGRDSSDDEMSTEYRTAGALAVADGLICLSLCQ